MIIVSCSTIPSRVKFLPNVVAQITKQTALPDLFCISVPKTSSRENVDYNLAYINEFIASNLNVIKFKIVVSVLGCDYGPLCKLLGALALTKQANTTDDVIVTIDDDQCYDVMFLETILEGARRHPNSVVCFCGHAISLSDTTGIYEWGFRSSGFDKNNLFRMIQLAPESEVDLVSGWCGVAYQRRFFPDKLDSDLEFTRKVLYPKLHRNDDLYISAWLSKLGIKKVVISYKNSRSHVQHEDTRIGRVNPLSLSGSSNFLVGNTKHFVEWWGIINYLRARGHFPTTARVKGTPMKSITYLSCMGCVFVVSIPILTALAFKKGVFSLLNGGTRALG